MRKKIVIAAGGSGGHLGPAQMLASLLGAHEIIFAGKGLQGSRFFDRQRFVFQEIASGPVKKPWLLVWGFFQALIFLRKFKPHMIAGFGSYHAFPVMLAAKVMRVPIILFEPNCILGKVNRFFAGGAKALAAQFPLEKYYARQVAVQRLPWQSFALKPDKGAARQKMGLSQGCFTLLVCGGSQGALFINQCFFQAARQLSMPFQVIHLTGREARVYAEGYRKMGISAVVCDYEKEMAGLFCAADLAICRAGAATVAELIHYEIPALLIPYPNSMRLHQDLNADFFEKQVKGGVKLQEGANINLPSAIAMAHSAMDSWRRNIAEYKIQSSSACLIETLFN